MAPRPFLILQARPETAAADDEFAAILDKAGLAEGETRRLRLDRDPPPEPRDLDACAGIIVGGGPGCVSDPPANKTAAEARIEDAVMGLMPHVLERDVPFLGCCYGIGILAHRLGACVSKDRYAAPVGPVACQLTPEGRDDPLLAGLPERFTAFVGHKEAVQALPVGCRHLVRSDTCPIQMIRHGRNVYATQFHPEADGDVFEVRIRVYAGYGYFPPEGAQDLIDTCHAAKVTEPPRILEAFARIYRDPPRAV